MNCCYDTRYSQDAHTENNAGWAEPLLWEIVKNPQTVIQPSVDQIDAWTIEYLGGYSIGAVPRGGFSWDLRYTLTNDLTRDGLAKSYLVAWSGSRKLLQAEPGSRPT